MLLILILVVVSRLPCEIDAAEGGDAGVSEALPIGTVTVLSASIAGGTGRSENEHEAVAAAIAQFDRALSDVVVAHGGVCARRDEMGCYVVVFVRARNAVACALELQLAAQGQIGLCIGLHTGEVQPGDDGNCVGPPLNRCVALRDVGHSGQTILSGLTSELVCEQLPPDAWLTELGTHRLRGQTRPERVLQLCHAKLCNDFPSLRAVTAVSSHNLPAQLTSFVGRRTEIHQLRTVVMGNRLITLTGAGGVGKTRLAIEVAAQLRDEFTEGVWYVDLAPITDPLLVPATVARTQGLPDQPGRSTTDTLRTFIGDQKVLLLVDNCEHLLDACSALIVPLLGTCPSLTVLATSREPIAVLGELTWMVPSLSLTDDAIQLFTDRAHRARPDFSAADDDLVTIAGICRKLDGIPLAIELAAARIRSISLTDIHDNLHDRFEMLTGGTRSALQRHQTLRASVDWSHAQLTEPERILFRRLGVFVGGFDLHAGQAVGGDTEAERHQVMHHLSQLVDKSLVIAECVPTTRYRLLETMRQYAIERLNTAGEADAVRGRHRDHYMDTAIDLGSPTHGEYERLLDWSDDEIDNLRAAFAWSREIDQVEQALRLASSLQPCWEARGRLREGLAWYCDAVPETPGPDLAPEVWVRAVVHANTLAAWLEAPTGLDRTQTALSIARQLDDPALTAATLNVCSILTRYDAETSRMYLDEAADLARASGDRAVLCKTLLSQTIWSGGIAGDPRGAQETAEECLDLADALGDRFMSWSGRIWLGNALLMQGNLDHAARALLPLVKQRVETGQLFMSFYANTFLGRIRAYQGQPAEARACWKAARATATTMGGFQEDVAYAMLAEAFLAAGDGPAAKKASETSWHRTVPERTVFNRVLNPMAEALIACDELVAARRFADDTVAIVRGSNKIAALTARAHIALSQGEREQAARDAHDALAIAADTGAYLRVPDALECLARYTASNDGNEQYAARLFGAGAAIRENKGIARLPVYQGSYDAAIASLKVAMEDRRFATAWAEGAALSIEEVITLTQRGRGKRQRPHSGWESLTPTETDVVRLVREGLSNNGIAARLLISRRTVQTHLTHVYAKLDLTSRVELVQEAARHT
jgi:predicted ATPase/DNA-binding CsgD family transcriptional regulator